MSTVTEKRPADRYADFDEYVDFQLHKTRSHIKVTDLLTAGVRIAAFVLTYLFLFVMFDHWVVDGGIGATMRIVLLAIVLLTALGWFCLRVIRPWMLKVTGLFAARTLEESSPELKSNLLNLIDLRRADREVSPEILGAIQKQAAVALSHVDVEEAVDRTRLMNAAYFLFGIVVLSCLYTLMSPKGYWDSAVRGLLPTAGVAAPTQTRIVRVVPGDADVLLGMPVEVRVDLQGDIPREVTLFYTTAGDRRFVDEPLKMEPAGETGNEFVAVLLGENGRGLLQDHTYRVEAGDAVSDTYSINVRQPPSAKMIELRYTYPDYMQLPEKTAPGSDVDVWEGTTVTFQAKTNLPVVRANLVLIDTEDQSAAGEEIAMTVHQGTELTADWKARIDEGTFPHHYYIQCWTEDRLKDPRPTLHNVLVRPDQRPNVALLPNHDLKLPANGIVALHVDAHDPDPFGKIRNIDVRLKVGEERLVGENLQIFNGPEEGLRQRLRREHKLPLEPFALKPGDHLTLWVEVRDNKQPLYNRRNSSPLVKILIVEPVTPEQAQEQHETDREEQQEQIRQQEQEQGETPEDKQGADGAGGEDNSEQKAPGDSKRDSEAGEKSQETKPGERSEQPKESPNGSETEGEGSNAQPGTEKGTGEEQQKPFDKDGTQDDDVLKKLAERGEFDKPAPGDDDANDDKRSADRENSTTPPSDDEGSGRGEDPKGTGNADTEQEGGSKDGTKTEGDADAAESRTDQEGDERPGGEGSNDPKDLDKGAPGDQNDPDAPSRKDKATGDETGEGTPDDDPEATRAKNKIDRKEGTDPKRKPSTETPDETTSTERRDKPAPEGAQRKPGDKPPQQPPDSKQNPKQPRDDKQPQPNPGQKPPTGKEPRKQPQSDAPPKGDQDGQKSTDPSAKPSQDAPTTDKNPDGQPKPPGEGQKPGEKPDSKSSSKKDSPQDGTKSDKGGNPKSSAKKDGDSGGKKNGPKGTGKSSNGAAKSAAKDGSAQASDGKPGDSLGGDAKGGQPSKRNGNRGHGQSDDGAKSTPGNLEDKLKTTELVLKRLQRELKRGDVDEELLKELGWNQDDLKRFLQRNLDAIQDAGDSPEGKARRNQFEEMVDSIDFQPGADQRIGRSGAKRSARGAASRRIDAPLEYRDQFKAFQKGITKSGKKP
ncbi:MAG: hypothetical protein CMJ48_14950 [Planctomycetaceae bacterium]|nr:hypothetical protein [Planctomycetaceae bacterium]